MQRAMWPTGWEQKVPIFKCSHCHRPLILQAGAHLPAPCPFPSHLPCWAYLLVAQEQYKRSQQMNSSLPGRPAPLSEQVRRLLSGLCAELYNLLYFSEGMGEAQGPVKPFAYWSGIMGTAWPTLYKMSNHCARAPQPAWLLQFLIFQAARGPVTSLLYNPSHSTCSLGKLGHVGSQLLCTIVLAGTKPRHWAHGRDLVLNATKE